MTILSSREKLYVSLWQLERFPIMISLMTAKALLTGHKTIYKIKGIQSVEDSIPMHQEFRCSGEAR